MVERLSSRPSPAGLARRAARLTLGGGARAVAAPVRRMALLGRREADPRWRRLTWIWQPGWGRRAQDRLLDRPAPYAIGADAYEQQKYATVMDTLAGRRFDRALEVGCGEGALAARLVRHADILLGVDMCDAAVSRAGVRVPAAVFGRRTLPHEMPVGTFDLIVCSDVLYYWEPTTLRTGVATLLDRLRPGGTLLAYHRRTDFGQAGSAEGARGVAGGGPRAGLHGHAARRRGPGAVRRDHRVPHRRPGPGGPRAALPGVRPPVLVLAGLSHPAVLRIRRSDVIVRSTRTCPELRTPR
ncbi:class I SAM-dependent DNA methyltransferase [Pseudonocardia sp. HH130630-07]|uniref:class I SAM-dependent DNA methyltransferase n=1 Tax=Pseudonocardia sp. HH130630-07 TaxID=1690815 RepID=UPI00081535B3|nr:SAM-dependent methyltransferase [Pseudonocardia sp. HH130630-07]ANY06963.1 hypothetical protein AFB00_12425 [Pseudonocardia sp. HH130630-07]